MNAVRIIGLTVLAACLYGIIHDQFTAHICVEYFTIGHPRIINSESPTMLAFAWGVVATWWVGLPLGLLLAAAARIGNRPRLTAQQLVKPIMVLLGVMGVLATFTGIVGWRLASNGQVALMGFIADLVPPDRQAVFLGVWWAHITSYWSGFFGGLVLIIWTYHRRRTLLTEAKAETQTRCVTHGSWRN